MKIERDFVRVSAGWRDYGRTYCSVVLQAAVLGVGEFAVGRVLHPAYYASGLLVVVLVAIQDTRSAIASRCGALLDILENRNSFRSEVQRSGRGDGGR